MPTVAFRLSDDQLRRLDDLRSKDGKYLSRSEFFRALLDECETNVKQGRKASEADSVAVLEARLKEKEAVIEANREEIEQLRSFLAREQEISVSALEASKAAQVLQAAEKPEKLLGEPIERPTTWQKIKKGLGF